MARPRKTNDARADIHADRANTELDAGGGPDVVRCLRRIRRMRGAGASAAIRWGEAMLASPQAVLYAESDLALLETAARLLQRLEAGELSASHWAEWRHQAARLMAAYPDRLNRGRVEIKPAAAGRSDGPDQLAAKREMKSRLAQ